MATNPQGQGQGNSINRIAEEVKNRGQETAQSAMHRAQETGTSATHRVQESLGAVGEQMSNLAGTVREKLPREGMLGSAAGGVARTLEAGGRYLQEHDLSDISQELSGYVRRYPLTSVGVCFGLGCLLGMTWSRR